METFAGPRRFVDNPAYAKNRSLALESLRSLIIHGGIDPPLIGLMELFSRVPHCFTVQSCCGHFVHEAEPDEHNLAQLLPHRGKVGRVHYRIAYIAFVLENSRNGHALCRDLRALASRSPADVQFGSAGWFREHSVNSYQIQVAPERDRCRDSLVVTFDEALELEKVRDRVLRELGTIAKKHIRLAED